MRRRAAAAPSAPVGREPVHFEAPMGSKLDQKMRAFLDWFNSDAGAATAINVAVVTFSPAYLLSAKTR